MAKVLYSAGGLPASHAADAVGRLTLGVSALANINTSGASEEYVEYPIRDGGVYSKLFLILLTNAASGAGTLKFRDSGADGVQTASIGAGATGTFEDTTNTDTLSAGDTGLGQFTQGSGGAATASHWGCIFDPDTDTSYHMVSFDHANLTNGTRYYNPIGGHPSSTSESVDQMTARSIFTASNLFVTVVSNDRSVTHTFDSRKDTGAGAMTVSVLTTQTGNFEDTMNSDSLISGSEFGYRGTGTGGSGTISISTWACLCVNVSDLVEQGGDSQKVVNAATTGYFSLGNMAAAWASEGNARTPVRFAQTFSQLRVRINANTVSDASSYQILKGGSGGALTAAITGSGTGWFEDTMNSDSFSASDELSFQLVAGATGTSITPRHFHVLAAETVSTGPPVGSLNLSGVGR